MPIVSPTFGELTLRTFYALPQRSLRSWRLGASFSAPRRSWGRLARLRRPARQRRARRGTDRSWNGPSTWCRRAERREEGGCRRGCAQDSEPSADDAGATGAQGPTQALEAVRARRLLPDADRLVQELQPRVPGPAAVRRLAV